MVRVVAISVRDHDRERRPAHRHHDDHDRELAGWAKHREPLIERPAVNKNLGEIGRWTARASKHSGEQFAPGTGTRKSS
jgi:hypothetical protein